MYKTTITNKEYLRITATLFIKNLNRLIEIEKKNKRGKIPLPLLKEKHDILHNIYEALSNMLKEIDYSDKKMVEFSDTLNEIGRLISIASTNSDIQYYEQAIKYFTYMIID